MSSLREPISLETAFGSYQLTEQLGEGGAGRVYGGIDGTGAAIAVKILSSSATDKRKRFKNEISFLFRFSHENIVQVSDFGIATTKSGIMPFYVMPRYSGSMRSTIKQNLSYELKLNIFSRILDGVEAAHLMGVVHRDLKPENVLISNNNSKIAVADFGIADIPREFAETSIETGPTTRLANFVYAAPEQRIPGREVGIAADIYALGLILNELFTGEIPYGTEYRKISSISKEYEFLDPIVAEMLRQNPLERPNSISALKGLFEKYRTDLIERQKLQTLDQTVVPVGKIDDPLAHNAPIVINAKYESGRLTLLLDRAVHNRWIISFRNIGGYTAVMGAGPEMFNFRGNEASVVIHPEAAQQVIDYFKEWLPRATNVLRSTLEEEIRAEEAQRLAEIKRARETAERNLAVTRRLRI